MNDAHRKPVGPPPGRWQSTIRRHPDRARRTVGWRMPLVTAALIAGIATGSAAESIPANPTPAAFETGRAAFVRDMVRNHGLATAPLTALLADARFRQPIIDAMNRPYEAKPWRDYRRLFLTPERIAGGIAYSAEHAAELARAEAAYGVPAAIIVAIIGIETNYGNRLGDHRALDALATLGFAYPRRAAFFRSELEHFVLLSREEAIDPRTAMGSYAGALGKPQFIPSSYRNYAVDFDGDGRRDLWHSDADVIGSVANYLNQHRWQRGAPIAVPARLTRGRPTGIEVGDKRPLPPNTSVGRLATAGVEPRDPTGADPLPAQAPAALLVFDGEENEYWIALDNFYAITRYNHSNLYALAALELSQAISAGRGD